MASGRKTHIVVDVERAGLVLGIELVVAAVENHRVGPADGGGE
jgi:hypothetical protein